MYYGLLILFWFRSETCCRSRTTREMLPSWSSTSQWLTTNSARLRYDAAVLVRVYGNFCMLAMSIFFSPRWLVSLFLQQEELKPGGKNIAVTNENRVEYIHRMADYMLNRRVSTEAGWSSTYLSTCNRGPTNKHKFKINCFFFTRRYESSARRSAKVSLTSSTSNGCACSTRMSCKCWSRAHLFPSTLTIYGDSQSIQVRELMSRSLVYHLDREVIMAVLHVLVHVCRRRLHGRPPGDRGVLAGDQRLHRAAATPAVEVRHQLFATAASWLYGKRGWLSLRQHDRL